MLTIKFVKLILLKKKSQQTMPEIKDQFRRSPNLCMFGSWRYNIQQKNLAVGCTQIPTKFLFQQGLVVMVNVAVAVDTVQVSHVVRLSCHRMKWE